MSMMVDSASESDGAIALRNLDDETREGIDEFIQLQRLLHAKAKRSTRFDADEKAALQIDNIDNAHAYFQRQFGYSVATGNYFYQSHSRGVGRVTRQINDTAASIYNTMQALSPIIDGLTDSGIPFAGLAVGTITFVFATTKNREASEKRIISVLMAIQDRILGLKFFSNIYKDGHALDQQIQSKIIVAYKSFVIFCGAVIEYFELGGFRRWLKSLGCSTFLQDEAASVHDAIAGVRQASEELLHKTSTDIRNTLHVVERRNRNLKQINTKQTKEINELREQIRDLQESQYSRYLEKIRQALGLDTFSLKDELLRLEKREGNVMEQFPHSYAPGHRVSDRLKEVEQNELFRSWMDSHESRVLVLAGQNLFVQASHCWMSPIAIRLIKKLSMPPGESLFTFYMLGERELDDTFDHTLATIVYRLLSQHRGVLRDKAAYARLWAAIQEYRKMKGEESGRRHEIQHALRNVVLAALNMLGLGRTVYIVLDRLDQCQCATEGRNFHRKGVLKSLVSLAEDRELNVKLRVLVVVNFLDWDVEGQGDDFGKTKHGSLVIRTISQTKL